MMIVGCFALIEPFGPMKRQFEAIREMGIEYADITDNHNGGMLGVEYGFTASFSLDSHPAKILRMAENAGLTLTSVCAHANLLDPVSPDVYGTHEIVKAIRLAKLLDVKHVITTEGDPKTEFGKNLTPKERLFSISHPETVGICLDTGNSWLGGSEPLDYIETFGNRIKHVHWKDIPKEWITKRGKLYGCGMSTIPLGDGVVGIEALVDALIKIGFDGPTTLEVTGIDAVKISYERLQKWSQIDTQTIQNAEEERRMQ